MPNALDPPNTGSELRAEQARVSGFVGASASRREPQVDRCRSQALFFEMNPIAQNDGPVERQAPRMTTLFAPALRTACRSEAMSATL